MKTWSVFCMLLLGIAAARSADYPTVEILRPNATQHLQPRSQYRFEWQVSGTNHLDRGDWNFMLETNGVLVGRLFPEFDPVYEGGGRWHADFVIPDQVPRFSRWDELLVELPSTCNYTLRLHEDVTEADGRSDVFCLGVPRTNVRVSQVEVCWNSRSNRSYQVQFRSAATTNLWTNLGVPVPGNGSTNCVLDAVPPGQPQRFYRISELPQ
jgi:hypothetical protein